MNFWHNYQMKHSLTLTILLAITVTSCGESQTSESLETPRYHSVQALNLKSQANYQVLRNFSGVVKNNKSSSLNFEVTGKVSNVFVNEGENVTKGQLLAELDSKLLSINKQQLLAQLSQIDAQISLNKANLIRVNKLISSDYASQQHLDELNSEHQILLANKQQVNANVAALQYQIDNSKIHAPFTGIINQKNIVEGEVVNAQINAFLLQASHSNELKVGLPKNLISDVKQQKTLHLIINKKSIYTDKVAINSEVNMQTRTVQLRFDLPNTVDVYDNQPGYFQFMQNFSANGFWVPVSAITDGIRGTWNIYVLKKTDKSELFLIESYGVNVLHTEQNQAFIQVDLNDKQQIIATGLHRYVPGELVTIQAVDGLQSSTFK